MSHMQSELERVHIRFVRQTGVDGKKLSYPHPQFSDWSYKYLHGRLWSAKELGCYLSHIECLRSFLASDFSYALILEDDLQIDPNLLHLLNESLKYSKDWDMLRLSSVNKGRWWPTIPLTDKHSLAVCLTREKGAGGYFVNRKAAKKMIRWLLPMRLAWDIAFDLEWLMGFKTLGVAPLPIRQNDGFESQIQHSVLNTKLRGNAKYFTVLPFRCVLEVMRVLYRSYHFLRTRLFGGG